MNQTINQPRPCDIATAHGETCALYFSRRSWSAAFASHTAVSVWGSVTVALEVSNELNCAPMVPRASLVSTNLFMQRFEVANFIKHSGN